MGFVSVEASKAVDHKPGTWRLLDYGYPNGHGEQIRMLFAIAKEPFEDVRLMPAAMTDGGKALAPYKTAALGSSSPLCGKDKVPAITMPDGTHMVETASIMKFLGTLFGLNGSDLDDAKLTKMNMLAQEIVNEIQIPLGAAAVKRRIMKSGKCGFPFMLTSCFGGKKADMERVEMLPSILARAEALLVGPYTLGAQMSYADVGFFAALSVTLSYDMFDEVSLLAPHTKLTALMQNLEQKAATYLERRTTEFQDGTSDPIEWLAAIHTPFRPTRLSRKAKLPAKKMTTTCYSHVF